MARLELPRTEKHNRWNRDLPPRARAADGDVIVFQTTSADDDQIDPERPTFVGYDRTRVHPLTGPGDALGTRLMIPRSLLQSLGVEV